MRKLALIVAGMFVMVAATRAQKQESDAVIKQKDSAIMHDVIMPAIQQGTAPDWAALTKDITAKNNAYYGDRMVTKGQIYYSYGKDWVLFSTALVRFTEKYENKDDLKLMYKNAKMVLEHSENPEDWKAAQKWLKHAIDKGSDNPDYKKTYDDLTTKINASK